MLYADKRALETNLKGLLPFVEKELNYYAQNCLAVGAGCPAGRLRVLR